MGSAPSLRLPPAGQPWQATGPDPRGAKSVLTGGDGHFAPLECLSAEALRRLPTDRWVCPSVGRRGNQGTEVLCAASHERRRWLCPCSDPSALKPCGLRCPVAPRFKTQFLGSLFPRGIPTGPFHTSGRGPALRALGQTSPSRWLRPCSGLYPGVWVQTPLRWGALQPPPLQPLPGPQQLPICSPLSPSRAPPPLLAAALGGSIFRGCFLGWFTWGWLPRRKCHQNSGHRPPAPTALPGARRARRLTPSWPLSVCRAPRGRALPSWGLARGPHGDFSSVGAGSAGSGGLFAAGHFLAPLPSAASSVRSKAGLGARCGR